MTEELLDIHAMLHDRERAILLRVAKRLLAGQELYGPFREDDERDMVTEAHEEFLDAAVYLAVQTLRDEDQY